MTSFMEKPRILIVDDDICVLRLMGKMLTALGWEVIAAGNGSDALDHFLENECLLVLTDLQMPGMDGWELAQRIKSIGPQTPVIAVTGQCREAVLERLEGSGMTGILFKPFGRDELLRTVQAALKPCSMRPEKEPFLTWQEYC